MSPRICKQPSSDGSPDRERHYHQDTKVEFGGKAFIVQRGNMTVYQWQPAYRIEACESDVPLGEAALRAQPSRMLRAQYQVVPFDAERRRPEIERLSAWRDGDEDAAVLLLHGPGGQGKTRLANYMAEITSNSKWLVVSAELNRSGAPGQEQVTIMPLTSEKLGILLLVDYAERWPLTTLLSLMQDSVLRDVQLPLRILLIGRPAGTWWQSVSNRINNDLQMVTSQIKLLKLAHNPEDWQPILKAARDAFLKAYDLSESLNLDIPYAMAHDDYPLVLAAHMAALALVDAVAHGEPAPYGSAAITEYLLGRERTYWMGLHEADRDRFFTDPLVMARTVFTATLTRPLGYEEGAVILRRVGAVETGQSASRVLADHSVCYPPSDPAMVLEPLYPDRLGEDFIALAIPAKGPHEREDLRDLDLADPWAKTAISRLLNLGDQEPPTWLPATISILVEISKRWSHVAEEQLYPVVRQHPGVMLLAGGSALASFSDMESVPTDLLEEIESILPEGRDNDLAIGRAVLAERLATYRLARTKDPVQRGAIYTNLGRALRNAGISDKEVVATGEAVKYYRMLSRADPQEHLATFAIALDAHGIALMKNSSIDTSIDCSNEAVGIYRRLYSVRPDLFGSELARTLTNLGNSLLRKHLLNDALRAQQEAVEIRRSIGAAYEFDRDDLGMASALVQLSVTVLNHRGADEAVNLIGQAVEIYRTALGSDDVKVEKGIFAHTLGIQGRIFLIKGMASEALAPLEEATAMLRSLVASNPTAHEGLLSQTLYELGVCFLKLGRLDQGIEALQEAIEIFPARYNAIRIEPNFVSMLYNLGGAFVLANKVEQATAILTDAVNTARTLLEQDPHEGRHLASALLNLSNALMLGNKLESALPIAQEAERLYRELAGADPEHLMEPWQKARNTLAAILQALGRQEEASLVRSDEP